MRNFGDYVSDKHEICKDWTEDAQQIIYMCDELCDMNPHWVIARLNNNDYIEIYKRAIIELRFKEVLTDEQKMCLQQFRRDLYWHCSHTIAEYCID